ncbi:tetraacyldisaccharide 4'-kinase [Candidatus Poribacteria bacterium]|nr:tetraacyldisaccharide 4'-kinase [Candidatus Poribacteria bacterium]
MKRVLYEIITGVRVGFIPSMILTLLTPFSLLYGLICLIRRWIYEVGVLKGKRLPIPVVCIGSVVAGGTGKTSMTIYLAELLASRGIKPVIICSGYGGRSKSTIIVSDGKRITADVEAAGDEAYMLAERMLRQGIPVIAGRDRFKAGMIAFNRFKPDLLLLDDGFQHLKLSRDLDLVVVDGAEPFGTGRLLPAGTLREPPSALKRADLIILMNSGSSERKVKRLSGGKLICRSNRIPSHLRPIGERNRVKLNKLQGKKVLAVCSIGNPSSFERMLSNLGCRVHLLGFPDHHFYSREDLKAIEEMKVEFDLIVTTAKDEPKLLRLGFRNGLVLEIDLEMDHQLIESLILTLRDSPDKTMQRCV